MKKFYLVLVLCLSTSSLLAAEIEGWIKIDLCYIYKLPTVDSTCLGSLKKKSPVVVEDTGNGWLRIVYAPAENLKTGKYIDLAGYYFQKDAFETW